MNWRTLQWAQAHFFVGRVAGERRLPLRVTWGGRDWRAEDVALRSVVVDLEKIRAIAERVVTSEGMALIDVELKGGRNNPLLRVYIDKPEGVSHADCQLVSEQLSAILDVEDPFPEAYVLEVSSPGLERELAKPSDYQHFVGRRARLVLRRPLGQHRVVEGRLAGFETGRARLELGNGELLEIGLSDIAKAKLVLEL